MPIFSYFLVVGAGLLGLLLMVGYALPSPQRIEIITKWGGMPPRYKAPASEQILIVRQALAPEATALVPELSSSLPEESAAPATASTKVHVAVTPKKKTKVVRLPAQKERLAQTSYSHREYGTVW